VQDAKGARPNLDPGPFAPDVIRALVRSLTALRPEDRSIDLLEAAKQIEGLRKTMPTAVAEALPRPEDALLDDRTVSQTWHSMAALPGGGVNPTAVPGLGDSVAGAIIVEGTPNPTLVPAASVHQTIPELPAEPVATGRSRSGPVLVGLGLAVCLGVGAAWLLRPAPPPLPVPAEAWPLELTLSPADPALDVAVLLDGVAVSRDALPEVTAGPHRLEIWMGTDCGGGEVRQDCGYKEKSFSVGQQGTGRSLRVSLPEVVPRTVRFASASTSALRARIGDRPWTDVGPTVEVSDVLPGVYDAVIQAGDCPDLPCGDDCLEQCAEQAQKVVVPFEGTDAVVVSLDIEAPAPVRPPAAARARARRTPSLVSYGRLIGWLERNPDYGPGGVQAAKQSKRYLRRWEGLTPPATLRNGAAITEDTPVESVSATVANRLCAGSGGLRRVDASPRTWSVPDGGTVPVFEIRSGDGGRPVLLTSDGSELPLDASDARPTVGFRCQNR